MRAKAPAANIFEFHDLEFFGVTFFAKKVTKQGKS